MRKFLRRSVGVWDRGSRECAPFLSRFVRSDRGSIALWIGLALMTFMGCAGMAIDTARGYMVKARLSQALDSAALAGAKSLLEDARDDNIRMFFNANFDAAAMGATVNGPQIFADTTTNTVRVSATATIDTTLMALLGFTTMTVAAEASAVRAINGLDVVLSIDISGSMCMPCSKIEAAITAANTMVDTLYNDPNPKVVTIGPTTYDLLNVGMVPWNAKVNVTTNKQVNATAYNPALTTEQLVTPFINPVTGISQDKLYKTNVSDVLLLRNPGAGWAGGIYARYKDDNNQTNDADLFLGYGTFGNKDWLAFDPIPLYEGEPRDGRWDDAAKILPTPKGLMTEGGTIYTPAHPGGINWNSSTYKRRDRSCYGAYYNDDFAEAQQLPNAIPNLPTWWVRANDIQGRAGEQDCTPTSKFGIVPLQGIKDASTKAVVTNSINALYTATDKPEGNTNAPQGLYWAWEVLTSTPPFTQARASTPFKRTQAIVLLTDGQSTGNNGDAYYGVFGPDNSAATTNEHGKLPNGKDNNFNNRLLQLAQNIKGADPAQGVKIFVVQYADSNQSLATLLKQVATEPNAPYYFFAPGDTELQAAFKQIAASLSVLRLSQ
jgi:Flp pilus assembly protein TadG